ncbi:MAG: LysM peptidoglycan-binding domain-containing protein [Rhabdochlamydiaceae bacterium]|jgi:LysM repeat protein
MSRRDTIIIAVLLNAGLLIVLFATSLKTDKVEDEPSAITVLESNQSQPQPAAQLASAPTAQPVTADQVDRVIEQYVTPQVTNSDQLPPNFLADVQAMEAPASASAASVKQDEVPDASYKEVKVKKGDVLERIARQNNVSVSDIMKINKLTSTRLKIGQVLKLPSAGSSKAAATATSTGAQYYVVKAGDNPWTIAVKHHMKVEELLKLNNMDEQKARRLKAGDKIRIK